MRDRPEWRLFGTVGAALTASVCCTLPLVVVSAGFGGASLSRLRALEPLRPLFIILSLILLGFAIYQGFRRHASEDACDVRPGRRSKYFISATAIIVIGLVVSPWLIASTSSTTDAIPDPKLKRIVLDVDGITCAACERTIRIALEKFDAVEHVRVSLTPPRVLVQYDPERTTVEEIMKALGDAGYRARIAPNQRAALSQVESPASKRDEISLGLESIDAKQLRAAFNEAKEDVRVVAVVSPTCKECVRGYEIVRRVFEQYETSRLRGFVVWLPMLAGDDATAATEQVESVRDGRLAVQGWDSDRTIGNLFAETLDLTSTAWDIYLVYAPGTVWEGERPPSPAFWMHQLDPRSGADQRFCLNPAEFSRQVGEVLMETSR